MYTEEEKQTTRTCLTQSAWDGLVFNTIKEVDCINIIECANTEDVNTVKAILDENGIFCSIYDDGYRYLVITSEQDTKEAKEVLSIKNGAEYFTDNSL